MSSSRPSRRRGTAGSKPEEPSRSSAPGSASSPPYPSRSLSHVPSLSSCHLHRRRFFVTVCRLVVLFARTPKCHLVEEFSTSRGRAADIAGHQFNPERPTQLKLPPDSNLLFSVERAFITARRSLSNKKRHESTFRAPRAAHPRHDSLDNLEFP